MKYCSMLVFTLVIILLYLGLVVSSPILALKKIRSIQPALSGNTLYVSGSGPGNYTRIQDAIDNTSDRDTVYVYHGTYVENLIINT